MEIGIVLDYLLKIKKENLRATRHFITRADERKNDILPDSNDIFDIILNKKPVGILKQDINKFKLLYVLTEEYDLIIIISVKNPNPITINLITCFPEKSKKRRRQDVSGLQGQ